MMKHLFLLLTVCLSVVGCSDDTADPIEIVNPTPKEQWGQTLVGNDGTIFA